VAHVDKFINYTDTNGVPRIRFVRIPFTCEIPIPGIVETDTVAFQQLTIITETEIRFRAMADPSPSFYV